MSRRVRMLVVGAAAAVVAAGLAAPPAGAAPGRATTGIGGAQTSTVLASGTIAPGVTGQYSWKVPAGQEAYQVGLVAPGRPRRQALPPRGHPALVRAADQPDPPGLLDGQERWHPGTRGQHAAHREPPAPVVHPERAEPGSVLEHAVEHRQLRGVWSAGLSPTGATSTKECAMELTRTYHRATTTGSTCG